MKKNQIIQRVLEDPRVRIGTARQSFEWFFNLYLNEFITYETAPFQKQMFEIAENEQELLSIIVSFRGSAKTTIMALAYPIWAILGRQQKKFVVIICDTQELAKQRLANIRSQFEHNALLQRELGPFQDDSGQWGAGSIVLLKYGARITVASREQSIRGITHNQHRPDVIILDDVENLEIVRTQDGRDKLHAWFHDDIIPLGSPSTKMILIGNLLHQDSLIMRQLDLIEKGEMSGGYYKFPVRINERILWPGKYPDEAALKRERKKLGDRRSWLREYELRIIPEDDQIIRLDWIKYYDELPTLLRNQSSFVAIGVDLAASDKESADYTAMVTARIDSCRGGYRVYILPHPVNQHMLFPEQRSTVLDLYDSLASTGLRRYLYIESFGAQRGLVDELKNLGYNAEGATPSGSKSERLRFVSHLVRNGNILFPRSGAEILIQQLVGFGVEKHKDLADAFTILLNMIQERKQRGSRGVVHINRQSVSIGNFYDRPGGGSQDWADREDEAMLHRVNPRNTWRRIIG